MNMHSEALAQTEETAKLRGSFELDKLSINVLARILEHIRASLR